MQFTLRTMFFLIIAFLLALQVFTAPLADTAEGDVEQSSIRTLVQQNNVKGRRQGTVRKYRRPRPRLSHRGPMPF